MEPEERFPMKRVRGPGRVPAPSDRDKRRAAYERQKIKRAEEAARREAARQARRALFRPCPFCGCGLAEIPYPGDITPFVQCPKCNATGPTYTQSDEQAIERWNLRVDHLSQ